MSHVQFDKLGAGVSSPDNFDVELLILLYKEKMGYQLTSASAALAVDTVVDECWRVFPAQQDINDRTLFEDWFLTTS